MKKILLLTVLILSTTIYAQERVSRESAIAKISEPFATLKKATGWKYSLDTEKWTSGDNFIVQFDSFNSFNFSIASYNEKDYLQFSKKYQTGYYKYPNLKLYWNSYEDSKTAIISLDSYKEKVLDLQNDNILEFDILSRSNDIYEYKKDVEKGIPYHKLVLKFRLNKEKSTARFLFYIVNKNGYIELLELGHTGYTSYGKYNEEYKIITSNDLYENFYYEMDYNEFLEFIKAPLNK